MSDRSSASITIGGTLPRARLGALLAAFDNDHVCINYGERVAEEADIVSGAAFTGVADEVRAGEFPETEAFCRAHGLRYVRRSDGCAGVWDSEIEIFTSESGVRSFAATSDGVVVTLDQVRRLGSLAAIEAHFAAADIDPGPLLIVGDGVGSPATSG